MCSQTRLRVIFARPCTLERASTPACLCNVWTKTRHWCNGRRHLKAQVSATAQSKHVCLTIDPTPSPSPLLHPLHLPSAIQLSSRLHLSTPLALPRHRLNPIIPNRTEMTSQILSHQAKDVITLGAAWWNRRQEMVTDIKRVCTRWKHDAASQASAPSDGW